MVGVVQIALASAGYCGPDVICGLVMVDTAPRNNVEGTLNVVAPMRAAQDGRYGGFATIEEAVAPLAAARGVELTPEFVERAARNLRQRPDGAWGWHWDPAFFEGDHGLARDVALDYLEEAARRVKVPALLSRGGASPVVDDAGVAALQEQIPHLDVCTIPGAGHMIVGDDNDVFVDEVLAFIARRFG